MMRGMASTNCSLQQIEMGLRNQSVVVGTTICWRLPQTNEGGGSLPHPRRGTRITSRPCLIQLKGWRCGGPGVLHPPLPDHGLWAATPPPTPNTHTPFVFRCQTRRTAVRSRSKKISGEEQVFGSNGSVMHPRGEPVSICTC